MRDVNEQEKDQLQSQLHNEIEDLKANLKKLQSVSWNLDLVH